MSKQTREQRSKSAFDQIWGSYRHLFKDDLARIAYRREKMIAEMRLFSTTPDYIDNNLENAFEEIAAEVLKELEAKPIVKRRGRDWSYANIQNIS